MGITIHYRGSIDALSLIEKLQDEVVDICQSMRWDYQVWNEDLNQPFDASLVHAPTGAEIKGHIPLRGITVQTDPQNESLKLLFNRDRKMSDFITEIMKHNGTFDKNFDWLSIKTQFGAVDAHIAIVKLLRYLKQHYISDLEVNDEGAYWETGDKEALMGKRGFLLGKISQVEQALSEIKFDHEPTREEILKTIDEAIKNVIKKKRKSA